MHYNPDDMSAIEAAREGDPVSMVDALNAGAAFIAYPAAEMVMSRRPTTAYRVAGEAGHIETALEAVRWASENHRYLIPAISETFDVASCQERGRAGQAMLENAGLLGLYHVNVVVSLAMYPQPGFAIETEMALLRALLPLCGGLPAPSEEHDMLALAAIMRPPEIVETLMDLGYQSAVRTNFGGMPDAHGQTPAEKMLDRARMEPDRADAWRDLAKRCAAAGS